VGRYAIQGEVATGGMATVHYGRLVGPAGFSRSVAIKRLHPQYAKDPHFVAMFLDEARLASQILHPNVVPILDVVAEGGELFLVMEFVTGESLSKLVRKTPEGVPVSIAMAIGVGMLEGLHAAHEARGEDGEPLRIVHRDVSPQNVIVGSDGVARLIDFGVAKATGNSSATRDGQIKGKIAYMPPEQVRGDAVDRRADIYAASVVLWEAVTGKRFFDEAGPDAALVLRALERAPSPPSSVRPEVPPELDAAIMRGLERDPAKRFTTAREMAQALEKVAAPAAAREVARWVEAKAGETVRLRAQQLEGFDLSVATELPGRVSLAASATRTAREPGTLPTLDGAPAPSLRRAPEDRPEPLGTSATFAGPGRRGAHRTRTGPFIVLGMAAAMGLGFYGSRWLAPPASPTGGATVETPTAQTAPASDHGPHVATTAEPTSPPAASAATWAEVPAAVPSATPARKAPPAPVPTPKPSAAPKTGCSPPYVITADGVRQYKPECLR
jgi:serine/threonine-protein kinase